jgi:nicotinamide mononucleotide adenylyltransferase
MKTYKEFGLIIGRFQPPCLHHLQFIDQVIHSGIKKLLIGVGDAQIIDNRNFLTAKQVESLLIPNLELLNFPYEIKIIPDIHNPPKYADHVKNFFIQINDSNTCLFTENEYLYDCFINYGHNFQLIKPKILSTRATNVRQMIFTNDHKWQNLVPINVIDFITNNKTKFW